MLSPEQFQEQVLPYLYDLLDQEEQRIFEATLEASAEARAGLEAARARRQLLAEAVKDEYPDVTFAPPVSGAKSRVQTAPTVVMPRRQQQRARRWLPWATAAAILLILLSGGGYLSIAGWVAEKQQLAQATARFDRANSTAAELSQKMNEEQARARQDTRAAQEQINLLVKDWNQEAALERKVLDQKGVRLVIQSPRALQAGAGNSIQIEMKRNQNVPAGKNLPQLNARVIDQTSNEVLYEKALDTQNGQTVFNVDLPRDLPVKPGRDLALEVSTKEDKDTPIAVREHLTVAAPEYVTHLYTDRPMYRPGETIRFRSLTLERFSMKPPQEELRLCYRITDPNHGEVPGSQREGSAQIAGDANNPPLKGPDGQALKGIGAGEFHIPPGLAGGQYTLHVAEASGRFPPEKRSFIIHQWQAPRFNKEITFDRSSYGPGEPVEITAVGLAVEGGAPGNPLTAILTVTVDGRQIARDQSAVGPDGRIRYPAIPLPDAQHMPKGEGIVSVVFTDGGTRETIVRPIPIVLGKLLVDFYPEGGDLVGGLPNRVYFQAHTPTGKPADLQGRIVDQAGAVVANLHTLTDNQEPGVNQGMGVFAFTPRTDKKYELKIDSPAGMHGKDGKHRYYLPPTKASGVVLKLPQGVVESTIDVEVTSADKDRQLLVGAYCRGKLLDHVNLDAKAGQTAGATLRPSLGAGGVYRITVFEKLGGQFLPLAERLIYRQATEKLDLTATADRPVYNPGDRVRLALEAKSEKKELSPAVLLVSVVDLSVHKLANDKTTRAMPTHFLLTSEVRQPEDLENADFFLGNHPKTRQAMDLLLGVQGWRRFAEQDPARFKKQDRDAGRILRAAAPEGMQTNNPEKEVLAKVDAKFAPRFVALERKLAEAEKIEAGNPIIQQQIEHEQTAMQDAQQRISVAVNNLENYERFLMRLGVGTLVIITLLFGLFMLYVGMRRLSRGRSAIPFFATGAVVLVFLFLGSLVGTAFMMGGWGLERFDMNGWGGGPRRAGAVPMAAKQAAQPAIAGVQIEDRLGEAGGPILANDDNAALLLENDHRLALAPEARVLRREQAKRLGGEVAQIFDQPVAGAMAVWEQPPMFVPNVERQLRRQGNFKELLRQRLNRAVNVPSSADPFVVREYAHVRQPNARGVRTDFTETLYWHPALVLSHGKGEVSFDLSDAATRFQVLVFGHTAEGRLGAATFEIAARLPVSIEPTVPVEVTSSDTIRLPVAIANDRNEPAAATLGIQFKNLTLLANPLHPNSDNVQLNLEGNKRVREIFDFQPAVKEGVATIRVSGDFASLIPGGDFRSLGKDAVERTFKIVPEGFPIIGAQSGLLEKSASHEFTLPEAWVQGTLKCQVQVFPSTLAELQKGLEALLREPNGCFEQSSTSNYPNVLILNYLKEADLSKPEVEKRARQLLTSGYAKLTSFECLDPREASRREGYEWFGQTAPPHEALTAYGLLQFRDMAKVYPVDEDMLRRTQKYLLGQRDGRGGFKRNPRAIDSFGRAPEHITNAYIVWALTESGLEEDLAPELKALYEKASGSADPYFVALAGIGHINQNKPKEGVQLLKNLGKFQTEDGHLEGAQASITGSGGRDLVIETTALATLGWLKANRPEEFSANIDKAVKWLGQQRGGYGGFGSTQSTILALKALIAHTRAHKKPIEAGNLVLFVGERQVAVKTFPTTIQEPITLAVPDHDYLKAGPNQIRVQITGRNEFPYTLSWSYQTQKPVNPENCPVHLTARLQKDTAKEGDTVRLTATVENKSGKGQGMTVAIIGLPGGLALPEDFAQLKEMTALRDNGTKPGLLSAWELRGRELILYWRDLAPGAKIDLGLDLVCRLPGAYRGPAPRAYLYYNADNKFWTDPLAITIHPAGE